MKMIGESVRWVFLFILMITFFIAECRGIQIKVLSISFHFILTFLKGGERLSQLWHFSHTHCDVENTLRLMSGAVRNKLRYRKANIIFDAIKNIKLA